MRLRLRLRCAGSRGGAREGESRAPGGGLRLRVRLLCGSIGSTSYREQGLRGRVGIAPTLPSSNGSRGNNLRDQAAPGLLFASRGGRRT